MKFTTAIVLAFAAASALGSPILSRDTAVDSRCLYGRDGGEAFLRSYEKRARGELISGLGKSISGTVGTKSPPPSPKRRGLASSDSHVHLLEKRRRRGGPDKTPSLFKSVAGAAGTLTGRAGSSGLQIFILKKMIPPAPPPPPPTPAQSSPTPASSAPASPQSSPSHPAAPSPAPQPPQPAPQPPQHASPFIPPAVPPFPHFPPQIPPAVPHVRRRSLSRRHEELAGLGKRRRVKPVRVSGVDGTTDDPRASRRAPLRKIKDFFSKGFNASSKAYKKTAPARKKGHGILLSFFDGLKGGLSV